jgi:NAD(P)-dependent dehydrogenase (short-subunit alcohol dehydrogenase family)
MSLVGKHLLITGGARRVGKALALGVAAAGGIVSIHHGHSELEGQKLVDEIRAKGQEAHLIQADLNDLGQIVDIVQKACEQGPLYALVNNAAIFEQQTFESTDLSTWQRHMNINLTAPFLLSQAFAR